MSKKSIGAWALLLAGGAFAAGIEWPGAVEGLAPGWTKSTAGVRAFASAHGLIFGGNIAPAGRPARAKLNVSVETVERGPVPNLIEAVGTAQTIASVALRSRVDAMILQELRNDGDLVQKGDVIVRLDDRQLQAQIRQAEAQLEKDKTLIEQSARDVARASQLLSQGSGPTLNKDTAQTALAAAQAAVRGDQAQIDNLKVQLSWYTLPAPITGRLGAFTLKAGNIARTADSTATGNLATINQMSPIYVAFPLPQVHLEQLRSALARGPVRVVATPQGGEAGAPGEISEIDNIIDAGTGTVIVRATIANTDELLWPGQLCNVEITLWTDPDDISVSRNATIMADGADYVYAVDKGVAHKQKVEVERFQDGRYIITAGLKGGETVVDDGKDLLTEGAPVEVKELAKVDDGAQ